ncbi:MAG TPA: TolC family protein [Longimicrobiales bacterium]|nr:TolC family protein [Longimicrobiales bacterium]
MPLALLAAAWAVTALLAQDVPSRLTLEDALRLARESNPTYLSQKNDQGVADWRVREAYGAFLPTVTSGGSMGYQAAGVQTYGTVSLGAQSTDWFYSNYYLNLSWRLDGNSLFGVSNARAAQRATAATIDAQEFTLESTVTLQYMSALRAAEGLDVARRQLQRAQQNLEIVRTRVESGAAAGTEGKQAEVDRGRAQVTVIQAEQQLRNQKLRLMEQIGLPMEEDVELASEFDVFEPGWTLDQLVSWALEDHPSLVAAEAQENASKAAVRQARSQYFPSLSLTTGFRGYANEALNKEYLLGQYEGSARSSYLSCMRWLTIQQSIGTELPGLDFSKGCGSPTLSDAQRQAALESNDVFPFDFTKNPLSLTASVSIPVFVGFSRQRQLEQMQAAEKDAEYQVKAEELRLRRAVTEAYNALVAAYEVVQIEGNNRDLAEQRLEAARQRYSIGAAPAQGAASSGSTFLELLDAQTSMSTAERDYLNAVYDFHQALAQLEDATGRTLRPDEGDGAVQDR